MAARSAKSATAEEIAAIKDQMGESTESIADDLVTPRRQRDQKLTQEIEQHPLIMLGIAAAIGFLASMNKKSRNVS